MIKSTARLFYCFAFAFWATGLYAYAAGDEILGVWIDSKKEGATEFVKCEDGSYVGKLVWSEKTANGEDVKDRKNPDKSLRSNSILGTVVMKNITYDKSQCRWNMPWAYDPTLGMVGSGYITLNKDGQLVVKGSKWGITVTRILQRVDLNEL